MIVKEFPSKEMIINIIIKGGNNKKSAKLKVNKHYNYIKRVYKGQNITPKIASNIILSISRKCH